MATAPFSSKFTCLLHFSEDDLKAFDAWFRSPWCNSNKNLIRLLDRLKKYYPDFDDQKLTKEKLLRQILPEGKFSNRIMNSLLSEAYPAAEKFLSFQCFSRDRNLQKILLAGEFQSRYLDESFFIVCKTSIYQH